MRKLDKDTNRLCAKRYSGQAAMEILLAKGTGGYVASDVVRDAEELARYGLRGSQLQRLTSLPSCNCRTLVAKYDKANRTGRQKNSIRNLINSPLKQMAVSAFLELVEQQLDMTESSKLVSSHMIAAIESFGFRCPAQKDQMDWERVTHAAFLLEEGHLQMVNCKMCATRHVVHEMNDTGDRTCPLCRVAASVTRVNDGKSGEVTQFLREHRKSIPTVTDAPGMRRARFHFALSLASAG